MSAKSLSLLAGLLQQAVLVLIIRYSKTQHRANGADYLTSVVVASSEVFKMCLSFMLESMSGSDGLPNGSNSNSQETQSSPMKKASSSPRSWSSTLQSRNIRDRMKVWCQTLIHMLSIFNQDSLKLLVPALLYLVQNNLLFVALSHLSVPVYQVTNQGKLLTTALISRIILQKHISALQYLAITLLGLGVAVIHLSEYYAGHSGDSDKSSASDGSDVEQNQLLGLGAVLISCLTSGFSGVYFEFILKKSKTKQSSLHVKNFQLAFWSLLLAIGLIVYRDFFKIQQHGLFQGFDKIVIAVIVAQGMTGFVVSLMLKYADAVLKGFAISVAAILSTVASVVFFGTRIDAWFPVGACLVMIAVKLYSYNPSSTTGGRIEVIGNAARGTSLATRASQQWTKRQLRTLVIFVPLFMIGLINFRTTVTIENNDNFKEETDLIRGYSNTTSSTASSPKGTTILNTTSSSDVTNTETITPDLNKTEVSSKSNDEATINENEPKEDPLEESPKESQGEAELSSESSNQTTAQTDNESKEESVEDVPKESQVERLDGGTGEVALRESKEKGADKDTQTEVVTKSLPVEDASTKSQAEEPETCDRKDIAEYAEAKIGRPYLQHIPKEMVYANCLFFDCNKNLDECDNSLPTNYDGPKPPCCSHILRDMSRIFDETMCDLGLDYVTAFGTLLGFRRGDHIIPWTTDIDYILPSRDVANAMTALWDTKKTGMAPLVQDIIRMCVTPDFGGGALKKWEITDRAALVEAGTWLCFTGLPYIDFYLGSKASSNLFGTIDECLHLYTDVFPTKRTFVSNKSYAQNFPANVDQLLRTFYGMDWMTPRSDKNPHGDPKICPYGPTYGSELS